MKDIPSPLNKWIKIEQSVIEESLLLSDNLNNSSSVIFDKINPKLSNYCDAFCEIPNLIYENGTYQISVYTTNN